MSSVHATFALIVLLLAPAPASQLSPAPSGVQDLELSIELRHPACFGCPEWRVTFKGSWAIFECFDGCTVPGRREVRLAAEDFTALVKAFDDASFREIPRLVGECFDCAVVTLTQKDNRRIHEVINQGAADLPALETLQRQLFAAAEPFQRFVTPTAATYRQLLDDGSDPNEVLDGSGGTMLNYAVLNGNAEAAKLLIERGARANRRALEDARDSGTLALLWTAAGVSARSPLAGALLRLAASSNWTENVAWLLARGVDVNVRDADSGLTPLMAAARSRYVGSVSLLLERGARVDLRDTDGNQALWYATTWDSDGLIDLLLARGARVDVVNRDGRTPLMHAAESCAPDNVRALIKAGADPSRKDKTGKTAAELVPTPSRRPNFCDEARAALGVSR